MKLPKLPTKLAKEPLVDTVFEMRVASAVPLAAVLPGLLFTQLAQSGEAVTVEPHPNSQLPQAVRDSAPELAFIPLVRVALGPYIIQIGDRMVSIACPTPYPGWTEFRERIVHVLHVVLKTGLVTQINRVSLKYIDLFEESDVAKANSFFDWGITLGSHTVTTDMAFLRLEIARDDLMHAVMATSQATVRNEISGWTKTGAILDVDTFVATSISDVQGFVEQIPSLVDKMHEANKEVFFDCLSASAIEALGAVYD